MKALETPTIRIVLYEGAGSEPLADGDRFALLRGLLDAGHTVTCTARNGAGMTPGAFADPDPDPGADDAADNLTLIVLGRFDGGQPPPAEDAAGRARIHLQDIGGHDPDQALQLVEHLLGEHEIEHNAPDADGRWKPWFPVIDYDRCTNCMQCLSFCLFDVYGTSKDGQIQVQNNDNCKTDCPACSRVCPEVAILFPKYAGGPINGDEVREQDVKREAMKVDISAMLGGDIYSTLKQRHAAARERFAKERDDKRALSERMKCLAKLRGEMDIPMEALKNLPSQEDIQRRAAEARAKAEAARTNAGSGR